MTKTVTFYIAKDKLPLKAGENMGFKKLTHTFDARYKSASVLDAILCI